MQYLLTILLCFQIVLITAQTDDLDRVKEKEDTIFFERKIYSDNGKICEARYFRGLKYPSHFTKEELFIRGINPFLGTDSIRQYIYDANWEMTKIKLIQDRDSIADYAYYSYSPEEFQLKENVVFITGRTHDERKALISIQNLTAQDFFIEIREKGKDTLIESPILLKNRSTKIINQEVKLKSGSTEIFLICENSNGISKDLKIQMIGYDLDQSNFVSKKDLKKNRTVEFKDTQDIFLDVSGNTKLLTIKSKNLELNIPTSKLVTKLESDLLPTGKYIFELHNLGAEEKRYCRVRIR